MIIRLLSINIWDLPIPVPGGNRAARRQELLRQLQRLDADVVLIQEAFRTRFKRQLATALPHYRTDAFLEATRRHLLLPMDASGGLLTLSRWPIVSSRFVASRQFRGMKPDERVGRKGALWTEIQTPAGPLIVGNAHLYAGLGPRNGRVRAMQTRQLAHEVVPLDGRPLILGGDFNMAVEHEVTTRGPTGFEILATLGLREIADGTSRSPVDPGILSGPRSQPRPRAPNHLPR